jgi:heme-degrading monooxygenase HmoA
MIMKLIKFRSRLSLDQVQEMAQERKEAFLSVPGLVQKYYFRSDEPGQYVGLYIWDSMESMSAYRNSELAASIPETYKLIG